MHYFFSKTYSIFIVLALFMLKEGAVLKKPCYVVTLFKYSSMVNDQHNNFFQHQMECSVLCKTGIYTEKMLFFFFFLKTCQLTSF